jgi:hypothetical protein
LNNLIAPPVCQSNRLPKQWPEGPLDLFYLLGMIGSFWEQFWQRLPGATGVSISLDGIVNFWPASVALVQIVLAAVATTPSKLMLAKTALPSALV